MRFAHRHLVRSKLQKKRVAILVSDGFEQSELTEPKRQLEDAGVRTTIISPNESVVRGWRENDWGDEFKIGQSLLDANVASYDALILPGGQINPDLLRTNERAVAFVRDFAQSGKPLAAICYGPSTLIEADVVRGRKLTSYPSIQTDAKNAGARWIDREVVIDDNFITSRSPKDLDAFCFYLLSALLGERSANTLA